MHSQTKLRTEEAAQYLGLSASFLRQLRCKKNKGPKFYRIGRRAVVYDKADLDSWMISKHCSSTHDYCVRENDSHE
ncbi:MAG: DNA-binding protein [Alphaproteobacteria bacterium]|nr:MAG: DNA-binding protein [Alphaproteobacteria bacterium]